MYTCMYNELLCDKKIFFFYILAYTRAEFSIDCHIHTCISLISHSFMYDRVTSSDVTSSTRLYEEINHNDEQSTLHLVVYMYE